MASKSGSRAHFEHQQKNSTKHNIAEPKSRRPSPLQVPKITSKSEPATPKQPPSELLQQVAVKPAILNASEAQKTTNNHQKGVGDSLPEKLSVIASLGTIKELAQTDAAVKETGGKLESDWHHDRKIPENRILKDSINSTKTSEGINNLSKTLGGAKIFDYVESGKSSMCRGSTSSDISDESSCSSISSCINKPHKANDSRWEAIQAVRLRDGVLGVKHFRLLKRLGCGDIGSVYLSELSGTKTSFAMKVMDKGSLASRKKLLRAQTEREILQSLDHPFLPTLYTHFETEKFSCLVMEFCPGGDLHTLRQKQPGKYFCEQAVKFYVAEILLALEYLHMLGIVYRDLKPENVLVREDGHIMLSDFDLSLRCSVSPTLVKSSSIETDIHRKNSVYCVQPACIEPSCIQPSCVAPTTCFSPRLFSSKSKKEEKPKNKIVNQVSPLPELIAEPTGARSMSFVGTHEYLAPEIIKGEGHGSAVDWWTFGIFLYELLFGKTPFKGSGNRATLFNVVGQPLRFPESPVVSSSAKDLIKGLLVKEPQNRLAYKRGATEIKQHPFFEGVNWALIRCATPPEIPKPVDIESFSLPKELSGEKIAGSAVALDLKNSDNYLEFDFF